MFCLNCGREIYDNATICPHCGYAIQNNAPPYSPSTKQITDIFKKVGAVVSSIGTVVVLIIVVYICTADNDDIADLVGSIAPMYSISIQNDIPVGYSNSLTYGQAFEQYFDSCKWSEETINSDPIVRFTGIFDNENGTYSKVEVVFDITDMDGGEFYYNIDTVIVDGWDLGPLGVYGLMEDVFNIGPVY